MAAHVRAEHQYESGSVSATVVQEIVRAIRRVRHGQVQIIIQDSRVVQIDTTEKLRLA
jgi:hypothetical protein